MPHLIRNDVWSTYTERHKSKYPYIYICIYMDRVYALTYSVCVYVYMCVCVCVYICLVSCLKVTSSRIFDILLICYYWNVHYENILVCTLLNKEFVSIANSEYNTEHFNTAMI